MIVEKTLMERVAMTFKSAGLGDRSAVEAARLMLGSGLSFETAAVMGQRMGEPCTATTAKIQEAAARYRQSVAGAPTKTAWGRPLAEAAAVVAPASTGMTERPTTQSSSPTTGGSDTRDKGEVLIEGVRYRKVVEYEPVDKGVVTVTEEAERRTRTAWGRPVTEV